MVLQSVTVIWGIGTSVNAVFCRLHVVNALDMKLEMKLNLNQNIGMSVNITVVDTAQKMKKIKLLNNKI